MLGWPEAGRFSTKRNRRGGFRGETCSGFASIPDALVADLRSDAGSRIKILEAVASERAICLILDEPASDLAPSEVSELLLDTFDGCAPKGKAFFSSPTSCRRFSTSANRWSRSAAGTRLRKRAHRRRHAGRASDDDRGTRMSRRTCVTFARAGPVTARVRSSRRSGHGSAAFDVRAGRSASASPALTTTVGLNCETLAGSRPRPRLDPYRRPRRRPPPVVTRVDGEASPNAERTAVRKRHW